MEDWLTTGVDELIFSALKEDLGSGGIHGQLIRSAGMRNCGK